MQIKRTGFVAMPAMLAVSVVASAAQSTLPPSTTIGFDDAVQGRRYYSYDGDLNGVPDVVLSTVDGLGFNTVGPGPNMLYIQEPGIEGTALLPEDLRVNFLRGAVGTVSFSYALNTQDAASWGVRFSLFDSQGQQLATTLNPASFTTTASGRSSFPENRVSLGFTGTAAYGTFDFGASIAPGQSDGVSRYIVDNLTFNYAGNQVLPSYGGTIASDPILPAVTTVDPVTGEIKFNFAVLPGVGGAGVDFPIYIDPPVAVGYAYSVTSGPRLAAVLVPHALPNGDADFILEIDGHGSFALHAGVEFNLLDVDPSGVATFRITGIDPAEQLDPTNAQAFVTGLRYVSAGAGSISQSPLTAVPEPATTALWLGGLLGLGLLHRHRQAGRAAAA